MIPIKKIDIEKKNIIKKCNKCGGAGCNSCYGYCAFIDKMVDAEIPIDYWFREMNDFYGEENFKNEILNYLKNIHLEYRSGMTMCFVGERGRGKTMAACAILKKALLEKFSAFYITLSDLVSNAIEKSEIRLPLKEYDFLTIDEVDSRFFPTQMSMELYGNQLENVLRSRMQNRLPTIICSNASDIGQIFNGEFKKSFESLGSQFIKTIPVIGKDARETKEKI